MNTPTVIILANQSLDDDLRTVFGAQQTASLMIAGYPLIEHILMELQDLQVQQCFVLARDSAASIQRSIGNTERWGMEMRIEVMNYSIEKEQVLRDFKSLSEPNGLLVIEADRIRSHCVQDFLDETVKSDLNFLEAYSDGEALGMTMLKPSDASSIINAVPIHLAGVRCNGLASTRDFHRANFDLIAGKFSGLRSSVWMNHEVNRLQHWASKVHRKASTEGTMMIAERCRVGSQASLRSVILNHDVFVERNTTLNNTIVMPNSVISGTTPIRNAIVNQNKVYQLAGES